MNFGEIIYYFLGETKFCFTAIKSYSNTEYNGCATRTKSVRDCASTYKDDKKSIAPNKER